MRATIWTPFYAETAAEAKAKALSLIKEGMTVAYGGSVTLKETGILDAVSCGNYNFLDRGKAKTPEELKNIYRKCFSADVYLSSANAITENGELYNVDGTGNRIAAIAYGPDSVIIVAGKNKIVSDLDEAVIKVKSSAAPKTASGFQRTHIADSRATARHLTPAATTVSAILPRAAAARTEYAGITL